MKPRRPIKQCLQMCLYIGIVLGAVDEVLLYLVLNDIRDAFTSSGSFSLWLFSLETYFIIVVSVADFIRRHIS